MPAVFANQRWIMGGNVQAIALSIVTKAIAILHPQYESDRTLGSHKGDKRKAIALWGGGAIALDGLENIGINSSVYPFSLCKYYVK